MGSRWKKLRSALGLGNLCVYVPSTLEDDAPPSSIDVDGRRTSFNSSSVPSSRSQSTSVSRSRSVSSKKTCAICLGSMRSGNGRALFTAECSHTFHFLCIASNVKHGNSVCPVCRATWKEIPFHAPFNELPHGRPGRVNPDRWQPEDDHHMTVLRRLPRSNSSGRQQSIATLFHISEPVLYNDDEPTDPRIEPPGSNEQRSSAQTVEVKAYTEFPAVERSVSKENFTILIHLKAPFAACPTGSGRNHSSVATQASRAPVDLVTVLDVSGSMAGTKLALLKRAMGFVIQNLGTCDRLSVVAFSSTARRLFHLRRMTESGRRHALQAVNSLVSSGGTNIAEGLRKGVKVMDERVEKNPVSSLILLSDGQDTYTMSSGSLTRPAYESLLPASVRGRTTGARHVPVHAFGFGADHDSESMHSISEASGGTFSFIETEGVIQDAFARCIGGLLSVVVQELRASVECVHPGARICSMKSGSYGFQVAGDGTKGSVDLGDLYAEEERDFLISINVPRVTFGEATTILFKVVCIYRDPVSAETIHVNAKDVSIPRPKVISAAEAVTSIEVDRQRNRLRAAEAMAEARTYAERGELSHAVCVLEKCRLVLRDTPSARSEDGLCLALDAELQEMEARMASRQRYEASGRAYVLSGLSSHSWQRATTRGSFTDGSSRGDSAHHLSYETPSMVHMLSRSQTMIPTDSRDLNPPVCPTPSQPRLPVRPSPSLHRGRNC